jgi:transketolase
MSTGSLGMGLSAGLGMAMAARLSGSDVRTWVLLGDGECQEGQVWEAAMVAGRYQQDNLIAVVDHNGLQQFGWRGSDAHDRLAPAAPGELAARFAAFGWRVLETDGHDMWPLVRTLEDAARPEGRPSVVVARTIKGKGVSFMEGDYRWHMGVPTDDEMATALAELGEPIEDAT